MTLLLFAELNMVAWFSIHKIQQSWFGNTLENSATRKQPNVSVE